MNLEIVMAAAQLVLAHSAVFVVIFLATLLAILILGHIRWEMEMLRDSQGLEQPYDPPKKIDWVHPGQVVVDATNDRWEVTFVGPDFVTVGKVKNISYDEIRKWGVIL